MKKLILILGIVVWSLNVVAQEAGEKPKSAPQEAKATLPTSRALNSFYRMDYVISELENGKAVNRRTYTLSINDSGRSESLRIGNRVPISTGIGAQFNYMDVGVNIDAKIMGRDQNDSFVNTALDLSTIATSEQSNQASAEHPLLRSWKMSVDVPLEVGKQMLLGSSEELTANHRFELELKITRIK